MGFFNKEITGSIGGGGGGTVVSWQYKVELMHSFKMALNSNYTESFYNTQNKLIRLDVYDTIAKGLKLFTKAFEYGANKKVSRVFLTDEQNGKTMETKLYYIGMRFDYSTKEIA